MMTTEDYNKYYIQGSDHYLIPRDELKILLRENQELKKQVEEYQKDIKDLDNQNKRAFENMQLNQLKVCNMIKQQKEFIKYLEDKIYSIEPKGTSINYNCEYDSEEDYVMAMQEQSKLNTLKEILQKYKEIIGGNKDEK
jgi:predicted RNase H-like nuclease (RuvC/YqgF family)